ncbi:MAG: Ig-like domain-containing protein [Candidatus Micrarchaeota archaeon]|nr:Ig-like domain-containing protein [Candidatus Micrarchaeota archaeon]
MAQATRLQSATEYLFTYGWAILIAAIVVASLYLFVFAPSTLAPSSCTFDSGVFCQDLILGSSSTLSKMAMLLTNSNPYPILDPSIIVNISGAAPIHGACVPNFVLPGGAVICSATISPALSKGALATGSFIFTYIPCPGGNVTECSTNARQSYTGSYDTHVSPLLSPTDITITLAAQNSSQVAVLTTLDKLTATVRLLGSPLSGATVNFTSNSINASISPLVTTTDGSGNAVTHISSSKSGNVLVMASFANAIANTIISFTPPICYTLSVPGLSGATSNALSIDGVGYSSFPVQLCYGRGTSHTYSFQTTVSGGAGIQYLFNFVSGCGLTTQSGTLPGISNCTLTANYTKQYFLTTSASPSVGGTVTPPSSWYNAGNSATLGETPSAGYAFNGWTGAGTGSYTGSSTSPLITFNSPISESGLFTSTSTTSTSTTSTSSTSTSSTSSTSSTVSTSVYTTSVPQIQCVGRIVCSMCGICFCWSASGGSCNVGCACGYGSQGYG